MKKYDVVALGELLYALRTPAHCRLERARTLEVLSAGSESNVVIGLSQLGISCSFISKIRDDFMGRLGVDNLRSFGVDTSGIIRTRRARNGLMFLEVADPPRPSQAIYDRKSTAIATLRPAEIDWDHFQSARNFYCSGITPALSKPVRQTVLTALRRAHDNQMEVFFDLNFRKTLWSPREAKASLEELLPYVDVLFAKEGDVRSVLGLASHLEHVAEWVRRTYKMRLVVITKGEKGAMAWDGRAYYGSSFPTHLVNRFGMGDSFVAGFIYGLVGSGIQRGLEYGCAVAALKGTVMNENYPLVRKEDVESLLSRSRGAEMGHAYDEVLR